MSGTALLRIVQNYTALREEDGVFRGRCPICELSGFWANQKTGLFHCQACHRSGDAITLLRSLLDVDFDQASQIVALIDPPEELLEDRKKAARILRNVLNVIFIPEPVASYLRGHADALDQASRSDAST